MSVAACLAAFIFVASYTLIVSEKIHRTIVALFGAVLMILTGILTQEQAISYIDFNTLGLLIGMMILVTITMQTGVFSYMAVWSAKKARGNPILLLVFLSVLTAFCSAFLDNVTTVLLMIPVTFSITADIKVPARPFIIAQIMASNIGGTATLIGDPPNIMIGSAVKELDFISFLSNLGDICLVILAVTIAIIVLIYRKDLKTTPELRRKIMNMNERSLIKKPILLKKCLTVLAMTVLMFIFHGQIGMESGTVALAGASFLMLLTLSSNTRILENVFSRVEWTAIFFFVGLFILVGALVQTGIINELAQFTMHATKGDHTVTTMAILFLSAIMSAFVDNIPFVATMIPLIKDMGAMGMTNLEPLWWALSLGACLGGNGTIVGASANVVAISIASKRGCSISFLQFMKVAFPLMMLSVCISAIYIYVRYL